MNHPNRNWRQNWTVNLKAAEACHSGGVTVHFVNPDIRLGVEVTVEEGKVFYRSDISDMISQAQQLYERALSNAKSPGPGGRRQAEPVRSMEGLGRVVMLGDLHEVATGVLGSDDRDGS